MKKIRVTDQNGKEFECRQLITNCALPHLTKRFEHLMPKETIDADKFKQMIASIDIDCQRNITPDEANTMVEAIKNYLIQEIDRAEKYYLGKGDKEQ